MSSETRTEAERQILRSRRAGISAAGCAAFVALAWFARDLGLVRVGPIGFWVLFGPWLIGSLAFVVLVQSGRNRMFADPALTLPQILWAALGPLLLYPVVPDIAQVCHLGLLAIGFFGAFRLSNLRYALTNLALAVGLGVAFVVQQALWADDMELAPALIGYAAFVAALGVVTAVGFEINGFRRKLTERNDELTLAFDRLRDMAVRDELTGIHNRRFLMDALAQQKALADRSSDHHFSLCFADLDHFKRVNDVFGHARGDLVLRQFAQIAAGAVRDVDFVARMGGEEFVLVLVGTDAEGARIVAERIRIEMARLSVSDLIPDFRVTASFGITQYTPGETLETVMARADAALYRAKHAGRDRISIDPEAPSEMDVPPEASAAAGSEGAGS